LTLETYYESYYPLLKEVEEQLEFSIYRCLDITDSDRQLAKYISSRIKSPDSIEEKLERKGFSSGVDSAIANIYDVIGIRIVVRFMGDIYTVKELLKNSGEFKIIEERDYITNPKESGYRSYHLIIETEIDDMKIYAEIQLRTMAMDCWASLEHQIRYKKNINNIEVISAELKKCSENLLEADITMEKTRNLVEKV
jgi:putative GTP pyrophosphokinase